MKNRQKEVDKNINKNENKNKNKYKKLTTVDGNYYSSTESIIRN